MFVFLKTRQEQRKIMINYSSEIIESTQSEFSMLINSAKRREIDCNITVDDINRLYRRQEYKCVLTGEFINFNKYLGKKQWYKGSASIDRIDNSKGYQIDNIMIVHKIVNLMRWNFSVPYFKQLCCLITNPQYSYSKSEAIVVDNHHYNYKGCGNISLDMFTSMKKHAETRKIEFNLTIQDLWNQFLKQKGLCAISNIPLDFTKHKYVERKDMPINGLASLDRVDSDKAYEINNIQWVHKHLNKIKREYDFQTVLKFSRLVCRNKKRIIVTSGYFNPIHIGHLKLIEESKKLGNYLIVIVNNDLQSKNKIGKIFQTEKDRIIVVQANRNVDEVILSIDKDSSVVETLKSIYPIPYMVTKGGDRSTIEQNNPKEIELCKELGIHIKLGVGGSEKMDSSTRIRNLQIGDLNE